MALRMTKRVIVLCPLVLLLASCQGDKSTPSVSPPSGEASSQAPTSLLPPPSPSQSQETVQDINRLISHSSTGQSANGGSSDVELSADGSKAVFISTATNLTSSYITDTRYITRAYLQDLLTGTTELIAIAPNGDPADGWSVGPSISADGNTVAFFSFAANLDPDASRDCPSSFNSCGSLYIYNVSSSQLDRIPVGSAYPEGPDTALSANGQYVAFSSPWAKTREGIFFLDRSTGEITDISVGDPTDVGTSGAAWVDISDDGRFVAFVSEDNGIVPEDNNGFFDVFVYDRDTSLTEWISRGAAGEASAGPSGAYRDAGIKGGVSISSDGRYVVFASRAANLISLDLPSCLQTDIECAQVYLYDRQAGQIEVISIGENGQLANGDSFDQADISSDGRWTVFASAATNLTNGVPTPNCAVQVVPCRQVFLRDRQMTHTYLISRNGRGQISQGYNYGAAISSDGSLIAYGSDATNLVSILITQQSNIYVIDRELAISTP